MKTQEQLSKDLVRALLKQFFNDPNTLNLDKLIKALERHRKLFYGRKEQGR